MYFFLLNTLFDFTYKSLLYLANVHVINFLCFSQLILTQRENKAQSTCGKRFGGYVSFMKNNSVFYNG